MNRTSSNGAEQEEPSTGSGRGRPDPADGHIEVNNQVHGGHHGHAPGQHSHGNPNHAQNLVFQEVESMFPPEEHGQDDRYEKLRKLGSGAFGAVVLVKDTRNNRLYAMKKLTILDDKEGRRNIEEVRLLKMMQHPTIVQLHDVFLTNDRKLLCLVMTYCDSGDLAQQISEAKHKRKPIPEKSLLSWFAQVFLGIHYLHEHHLLHRDLKPQNLFLTESKKLIKIGDLGLAKMLTGDAEEFSECGTPYYTAPEMINNQPYALPSDIWSLGICLYECLATHLPFKGESDVDLVKSITSEDPPPLPDHYSQDVRGLVRWMLQKTPERRPTISQLLATPVVVKHMAQFIKEYRPMHIEERQRRAQIKDMNQQAHKITEKNKAITTEELQEILAQPDPEKVKAEQQIALEKEQAEKMDESHDTEGSDMLSPMKPHHKVDIDLSHGERKTMSMSMPAMSMPMPGMGMAIPNAGENSGMNMSWISMPSNSNGWEMGVQMLETKNSQEESFHGSGEEVKEVDEEHLGLTSPSDLTLQDRKMERRKSSLAVCEVSQPIHLTLGLGSDLHPSREQQEDSGTESSEPKQPPHPMLKEVKDKENYISQSLNHNRMMQEIDDANHMEEILNQFDKITRKSVDHNKGHLRSNSENMTEIAKELNDHAVGPATEMERHKNELRQSAENLNQIMDTVQKGLRASSNDSVSSSKVSSRLHEALEYGQDMDMASSGSAKEFEASTTNPC